ncbi:MAG: ECF-type sigma factor [Planctomycetota bacterium]
MDDPSVQLIHRWREGDEHAASEIYDRYVARLVALAGSRISPRLARRVEAEDVVQSVYRSFFARTGDNRIDVQQSGQIWGLLAAITVNKVRAKARFHAAIKRDVGSEASVQSSISCYGLQPTDLAREPTADEAAELAEQYQATAARLSALGKKVFALYLENESVDQIAKHVRRSSRTVRRELDNIRKNLTDALASQQS